MDSSPRPFHRRGWILRTLGLVGLLLLLPPLIPPEDSDPSSSLPLKDGMFLVAAPGLRDPHFSHTVVLLVAYGPQGALGLIVNRPLSYSLKEALPDAGKIPLPPKEPLYYGGPVQRHYLFGLFRSPTPLEGAHLILEDLYFTGRRDTLLEALRHRGPKRPVRIFAGYAGWAPGQLDREFLRGDWLLMEARLDQIFSDHPEHLWEELFQPRPRQHRAHRFFQEPLSPLRIPGILEDLLGNALAWAAPTPCESPPEGARIPDLTLVEVARGFQFPVHLTHAGDGSARLYVVEQRGVIWVLEEGQRRSQPFLDIRDRVESGGEKGLLSVAFHPRFQENRLFYVNYTTRRQGRLYTHISRFRARTPLEAVPDSEEILMAIPQPYANHNGGQLAFGPDGYLYIGMGDGGSGNDPHNHGQNPATLLGALLRIDVDHPQPPLPYGIPPDNPFVGRPGHRPEIWAYGFRNPWRFSFDAGTGLLYVGDVGQDEVEEIDLVQRGGNYGWRVMEGDRCTPGVSDPCNPRRFQPPLFTYTHQKGSSVIGGFVYRGHRIPDLCGTYLFADYFSGRLWGLRQRQGRIVAVREILGPGGALERLRRRLGGPALPHISSFGEGPDLELYVVDHVEGRILQIQPTQ